MHKQRIDRSHITSNIERIGVIVATGITVIVTLGPRASQVHATLEPLVRCISSVDTPGETFVTCGFYISFLIQVAYGRIHVVFLSRSGGRKIVFLTVSRAFDGILPVQVVIASQASGNQFTVIVKQLITSGIVDITTDRFTNHVSRGICGSIACRHAGIAHHGILLGHPGSFHPAVCIQTVVLGNTSVIHTLIHLQRNTRFVSVSSALGCNDDNTVGSTVTV